MRSAGDWLTCPHVVELLLRLDEVVASALLVADPETHRVASHLVARRSKHVRPALFLLAAEFGCGVETELLRAAAALELLHVASLYHDDVVDRATTRRGGTSVNAAWTNSVATAGGVFLFARATALLASLGEEVNRTASAAVTRLCTGQLREVEHAYDVDIPLEEHLDILAGKTATLFELPCRLGGQLAGLVPAQSASLVEYARELGLAFQLADDALDFTGTVERLGKTTLTDISQGIYSFPVIHVLRGSGRDGKHLRDLLRRARLSEDELGAIAAIVRGSDALAAARRQASECATRARDALRGLPEGPALRSLRALAAFSVSRSH